MKTQDRTKVVKPTKPKAEKKNVAKPAKSKVTKKVTESFKELPLIKKIQGFLSRRYEYQLNQVSNRIEVKPAGKKMPFKYRPEIDNDMKRDLMEAGFKGINEPYNVLMGSSFVKRVNPIVEYFKNLEPWDKKDRFSMLSDFIKMSTVEDDVRFANMLAKHLTRHVASVMIESEEGFFNKHCLVIVSNKQSIGKSSLVRWFAPDGLRDYFTEDIPNWADKDSLVSLTSNWIINLDEIDGISKQEIAKVKSALSRDHVNVRRPYARCQERTKRLANFWGTSNNRDFLTDLTGNIRFICFDVQSVDFKYTKEVNIRQLWAQAYHCFKLGDEANWKLSKAEEALNEEFNKGFAADSFEVATVRKYLIPADPNNPIPKYGNMIHDGADFIMMDLNKRFGLGLRSSRNLGRALQKCGFKRLPKYSNHLKNSEYGYWYYIGDFGNGSEHLYDSIEQNEAENPCAKSENVLH
jgi:predicted P-loop ATPase